MKRVTYKVNIGLVFTDLTLEEANTLEVFMDGLTSRDDWGIPSVSWALNPTGVKETRELKKAVSSKDVLKLEKESGGKPCGK